MGSGTSRGKRVAPACVREASVSQTAAPKQDSRPLKPLQTHAALRNARSGAPPPDRHSSAGQYDTDLSRGEEDDDGELDTVLADAGEERGAAAVAERRPQPKKAVVRSKTYGLCHFSQEDDRDSSPEETRGSSTCGSRVVNRRSINGAFQHTPASSNQHCTPSSSRGFLTRGSAMKAFPTPEKHQSTFGKCHNSSVAMPVILYDGSEEELMDTIEREFS